MYEFVNHMRGLNQMTEHPSPIEVITTCNHNPQSTGSLPRCRNVSRTTLRTREHSSPSIPRAKI